MQHGSLGSQKCSHFFQGAQLPYGFMGQGLGHRCLFCYSLLTCLHYSPGWSC